MIVKKFEAVDMQEALKLVKNEMGSNAVILSTRSIKKGGGAFGLFGRPVIEVTAAVDYDSKMKGNQLSRTPNPEPRTPKLSLTTSMIEPLRDDITDLKEMIRKYNPAPRATNPEPRLNDEVKEIKEMMGFIIKHSGMAEDFGMAQEYLIPYQKMLSRGINEKYAAEIINKMQAAMTHPLDGCPKLKDTDAITARLADELMKSVKTSGAIHKENGIPKVVAFIGPTGVGKTTTIAKLAAAEAFAKKRAAIITIDTYRIAAVEQIKIYAKIIGIPVDVVMTPKDLADSINMHKDKDIIMIDTAGRSHKNDAQLLEISEFLTPPSPPFNKGGDKRGVETHLVLSANSDERNIEDTIDSFKEVAKIDRLLFTKLDETSLFGVIYNQHLRTGIPLSYFTTGQKVPEDIEAATPERVADLILQLSKTEG
jgi:flagellar biosynthesis protein FlhF